MRTSLPVAALLLACVAARPAVAQDTHRCASVPDPEARLACYDRAFPVSAAVREAAETSAIEDFGLDTEPARLGATDTTPAASDPERIESRIAKVTYDNGRRTISLENGQVWRLTETSSKGHMQAGERVAVRKALMGTYMLVTEAGVGLRVRRVR